MVLFAMSWLYCEYNTAKYIGTHAGHNHWPAKIYPVNFYARKNIMGFAAQLTQTEMRLAVLLPPNAALMSILRNSDIW